MIEIPGLKYVGKTSWSNVFHAWREREGTREEWQKVAKDKGWATWEEWRNAWVRPISAQERKWFRYSIEKPLHTIPQFLVGPSQSWQKHFPENERNLHTFAELVERVDLHNNKKVAELLKNFPRPTEFIGICLPDKKIVCIEGHHRATALAIAAKKGHGFPYGITMIDIAFFEEHEKSLLDDMLIRGSVKQKEP